MGCDLGPIARRGVMWAPISQEWADRLLRILEASAAVELQRNDYTTGYMATLDGNAIASLNSVNDYRAVTPEMLTALREFLREHRPQIDEWTGHRWRVCSVRAFNLRPSDAPGGRHVDGWPPFIRKAFILPKGATPATGTTWFRLPDGKELLFESPGPCVVLFENSRVEHALMPGTVARPTIELDIVPASVTSTEPVYAGLNGWYPWFPA